jgi:DNA invertase Pin-like site-specific DNA recombinase
VPSEPYNRIASTETESGGEVKICYARTSTVEQVAGLEPELRTAAAEKVFSEPVSSVARREQLEAALEYCREGDVLFVTYSR